MNTLVRRLRKTFPWKRDKASKALKSSSLKTEDEVKEEPLDEDLESKEDNELDEQDDDSDFEVNSRKLKQKLRKIAKNSLPQFNIDEYVLLFWQLKSRSFEYAIITLSFPLLALLFGQQTMIWNYVNQMRMN